MAETRLKATYKISVRIKHCPEEIAVKSGVIVSQERAWIVGNKAELKTWPIQNGIMHAESELRDSFIETLVEMVSLEEVPYNSSLCPHCLTQLTKQYWCDSDEGDIEEIEDDKLAECKGCDDLNYWIQCQNCGWLDG